MDHLGIQRDQWEFGGGLREDQEAEPQRESQCSCAERHATGVVLRALSDFSLMQAHGESITLLILLEGNLKITQLLSAKLEFGASSPWPQSTACSMEEN